MADFNEQLPDWQEAGIEPPPSKKTAGWQVNDKPPAGWLNWLFNRTYKVLAEIRSVFSAHAGDNTRHLTAAERTTWNAKETPGGAQTKADAAEAAAKAASIPLAQKGAAGGVASLNAESEVVANGAIYGHHYMNDLGRFSFSNVNQKIDIFVTGNVIGYLDISISGTWYDDNAVGNLTKRISIHTQSSSIIDYQDSEYINVNGRIRGKLSISDLEWSSVAGKWKVSIESRSADANTFSVFVEGTSPHDTMPIFVLGQLYTGAATTLPLAVQVIPDDTVTKSGQQIETTAGAQARANSARDEAKAASIPIEQRGAPWGVGALDGDARMPVVNMPADIRQHYVTTLPGAGWYRIAQSPLFIAHTYGKFVVDWSQSGYHGIAEFSAGVMYGSGPTITQTLFSNFSEATGITAARIVTTPNYIDSRAYLEVYSTGQLSFILNVFMYDSTSWEFVDWQTGPGTVPDGYFAHTLSFAPGIATEGIISSSGAVMDGPLQHNFNSVRKYYDVANVDMGDNVQGMLKITLPHSWSNTMLRLKIEGLIHSTNPLAVGEPSAFELLLTGYTYAPQTAWLSTSATIAGAAPFKESNSVRFAHDGNKCCILIGFPETIWGYPKITLSEVVAGYTNINGWAHGWDMSFLPSYVGAGITETAVPVFNKGTSVELHSGRTLAEVVQGSLAFAVTTGTAPALAASITPAPAALSAGLRVSIKAHVATTGPVTLNLNGLGAKSIKKPNGNNPPLVQGGVYTVIYDGSVFTLQGEGGEYGTAGAAQTLTGYTVGREAGLENGVIPLKTSQNGDAGSSPNHHWPKRTVVNPSGSPGDLFVGPVDPNDPIPTAFVGDMWIRVNDPDFNSANIPEDINIFGLQGGIPRRGVYTNAVSAGWDGNQLFVRIPGGVYQNNSGQGTPEIVLSAAQARADGNIVPSNIRAGVWVYGVAGALVDRPKHTSSSGMYGTSLNTGGAPFQPDYATFYFETDTQQVGGSTISFLGSVFSLLIMRSKSYGTITTGLQATEFTSQGFYTNLSSHLSGNILPGGSWTAYKLN
ncbi:hypothetical protein [Paenibacillus sp. FSL H8-0259]|uniref:hypothetical protein n=1 Tax=Paenibacillus sp. FSL H8-0259 TaxID=1920423 RepID=UPI00096F8D2D|nr:hypothetical protein [Paenibacillus sp. FSL H8-0259]OMF28295.1 hypothetical protein BK132_14650 [Paenibacillus sp. FSL H8-0259]